MEQPNIDLLMYKLDNLRERIDKLESLTPRYLFVNSELAMKVVKKLSKNSEPGALIPLTPQEWEVFHRDFYSF